MFKDRPPKVNKERVYKIFLLELSCTRLKRRKGPGERKPTPIFLELRDPSGLQNIPLNKCYVQKIFLSILLVPESLTLTEMSSYGLDRVLINCINCIGLLATS